MMMEREPMTESVEAVQMPIWMVWKVEGGKGSVGVGVKVGGVDIFFGVGMMGKF